MFDMKFMLLLTLLRAMTSEGNIGGMAVGFESS